MSVPVGTAQAVTAEQSATSAGSSTSFGKFAAKAGFPLSFTLTINEQVPSKPAKSFMLYVTGVAPTLKVEPDVISAFTFPTNG